MPPPEKDNGLGKNRQGIHLPGSLLFGALSCIYLAAFLWLMDIAVIFWKAENLSRLLAKENLLWEALLAFFIYCLIGSIAGIILGLGDFLLHVTGLFGRGGRPSRFYFPILGGAIFLTATGANVLAMWFPNTAGKGLVPASGLLLGGILLACVLGYLIYTSEKRLRPSLSQWAPLAGLKSRKAGTLLFIILAVLTGSLFFLYRGGRTQALPRGDSRHSRIPSVILILVDTLRADHVSCYSRPGSMTPHIDRLAEDSVLFTNAYTQAPWTLPAMASLMTSLYPSSHGAIHGLNAKDGPDRLLENALTMAEYLRQKGYYTAGFVTNVLVSDDFGFGQGFDAYYYLEHPIINRFSLFMWLREAHIYFIFSTHVKAGALTRRALAWAAENTHAPFFLYLHYFDPHRAYLNRPGKLISGTDTSYRQELTKKNKDAYLRSYSGEIAYTDASIGEFLRGLREAGLYDNSLIIFTSDHGEEFAEHGGWDHGRTLYEEQLRVPLMIKLPKASKGITDRRLVRLVDVFPTLLNILGEESPSVLEGQPVIDSSGKPVGDVSFVFSERLGGAEGEQALREDRWKLILSHETKDPGKSAYELYDLENDPAERRDLSSAGRGIAEGLRTKLEEVSQYARKRSLHRGKALVGKDVLDQLKTLGYVQ